jgi:hypothetical protein
MAFRIRKLGWQAGCVGLALFAGTQADRVQAAPQEDAEKVVQAAAVSSAIVDSLIEDAMEDGSITAEEKRLIMGQARRRLSGAEVAEIEARVATLPATSAIGSVTKTTQTGQVMNGDVAAAAGDNCCDEAGCGGHFDNMYIFGASDGWAGPIDDDDGNNFGLRLGFNAGMPLDECRGIAAQFGMSYGAYNFHGRDTGDERSSIEEQWFFTLGVFKRADLCAACPDRVSWGIVYDHLITDNLGEDGWEVGLGQFRGQVGYALSHCDEVGLMASIRADDDEVDGSSNNEDATSAIDQLSVFWHHKWPFSADTTVYTGIVEDVGEWIFGAKGEVPISNCVSLFGGVHYILPSTSGGGSENYAEEIWNVTVGVAYYPGGNAVSKSVAGRRWMPLLPVADNGTFALDISPSSL